MYQRIVSGILFIFYSIWIISMSDASAIPALFLTYIFPIVCIWFPEEIGGYTGFGGSFARPAISDTSPGCMVSAVGWILLLVLMARPFLFTLFFS